VLLLRGVNELFSLNRYLFIYRWRLLAGCVCIIASNLFAVYPAKITRQIIDTAILTGGKQLSLMASETIKSKLLHLLMLLLVATVLKGVFMFLMRQSLIVMSRFVEYDLKNEIFSKLQKLPMGFYKHAHTGDVMSRMSEDVGHVRMYVGPSLMYLINLMVMSVMVIYAMFSVNTVLACWVLLPLPFLSLVVYAISRIIQKQSTRIQSQVGWISTLAQETFSGIRVVQSLAAGPEFKKRMQQEGEKYFQYTTQQIFTEALYQPAIGFLIGLSVLLTVLVGGILVSKGEITPGNIAEFILYVYMLTWPFTSLGWVSALMQKAAASMRRINQLLDTEEAPLIRLSASEQISKPNIRLEAVTVQYAGMQQPALHRVSLNIATGSSLGITGRTGSGKSTLLHVLSGFVYPTSGNLYLNDHPLPHLHVKELRQMTGLASQDVFLFSDTIQNNIAFAKPGASRQEVELASEMACFHQTVMQFGNKYDTLLGERGINLSGGQRQRLSLARAFLAKPSLLMIDDCLSALDTATESSVVKEIMQMKGVTKLLAAHRLSTLMMCDTIIYLENGSIVEQGTHAQLMEIKGRYYQTWLHQHAHHQN